MIILTRPIHKIAFTQKFLLILFFLGSFQSAFAQQQTIDSLLGELKKHPKIDTIRINLLSDLAYDYHTILPDSTILLSEQAYTLSEKIGYQRGIAKALKYWAMGSYLVSRYDEAIQKNKESLAIYEKIGDLKGCASVLNNIAIIKHNQGELDEALTFYSKSLEIRKKVNDQIGIAASYNNIGNTYSDKGNFSEGLSYLFKGLRVREKINDPIGIANSLANIGNIYYYMGKYEASLSYSSRALVIHENTGNKDGAIQTLVAIGAVYHDQKKNAEAITCFVKALKMSEEMGNLHSVALCLNHIGDEYISQQRYGEAMPYYERSMKLSEQSNDLESIAISHNGIAQVLLHDNKNHEAIEHLLISSKISASVGAKPMLLASTENLAKAYEKLKDYSNMARSLQQVIALKDSLFNDEVIKKTQQIEFNFILDKKQKEIALLEKDSSIQKGIAERRRFTNISLGAVLLLSLAFAFALWRSNKKVQKANLTTIKQKEEISRQAEELKELNTLKDRIFSVLSHDLRGPIASLTGIMSLMDEDMITPQEFSKVKEGMNNQLSALRLLLDNLLYWSRSQLNGQIIRKETINIVPLIEQNIQLLSEAATQKNISLVFNNTSRAGVMAFADMNHTDIVIRNLISNALKFTNLDGQIEINAEANENAITISVKDNGIGIDNDIIQQLFTSKLQSQLGTSGEKGTGLGLLLCKDFAEQNNGKLSVTSKPGEGSIFYFTLPKA